MLTDLFVLHMTSIYGPCPQEKPIDQSEITNSFKVNHRGPQALQYGLLFFFFIIVQIRAS